MYGIGFCRSGFEKESYFIYYLHNLNLLNLKGMIDYSISLIKKKYLESNEDNITITS